MNRSLIFGFTVHFNSIEFIGPVISYTNNQTQFRHSTEDFSTAISLILGRQTFGRVRFSRCNRQSGKRNLFTRSRTNGVFLWS